jgi:hypothetical protein
MKDSRVTIWTNPTTHATGNTTNAGPTVDLRQSGALVGGPAWGTDPENGVGVEIIQTVTSGTGQVTVWEFEVSDDASTWRKGGFIASSAMDAAGTVRKFRATLKTSMRYFRLFATNSGTGTSTSVAYAEDATGGHPQAFAIA